MADKEVFKIHLDGERTKGSLGILFNAESGRYGQALERVFDAKLTQDPNGELLIFEAAPENKDKIVYAFRRMLYEANEHGIYCVERGEDLFKRVKALNNLPEIPKGY